MQHRLAILDDYQDVAHGFADWAALEAEGVRVVTYREPFASPEALVAAMADATMVVAMRERTAFPREVLEKLPGLQLLVTTGMANASIDVAAAVERIPHLTPDDFGAVSPGLEISQMRHERQRARMFMS